MGDAATGSGAADAGSGDTAHTQTTAHRRSSHPLGRAVPADFAADDRLACRAKVHLSYTRRVR